MLHYVNKNTKLDFFFCLSAFLQLLLCAAISKMETQHGKYLQHATDILNITCSLQISQLSNAKCLSIISSATIFPHLNNQRHTPVTEHKKTDSSIWIVSSGTKTTFSKQHLTFQLKYFRLTLLFPVKHNTQLQYFITNPCFSKKSYAILSK